MFLLVLGVVIWSAVHLWKRVAPESRAKFGDKGKLFVAIASVLAIVMMVLGYRAWDGTIYWGRTPAMAGINNLLMFLALYLYATGAPGPGRPRVWLGRKLRHPQLTGFSVWAVAHLLVNGDTPSFVLFGGLLVWAVVSMVLINRAEPVWTPAPERAPIKELIPIVVTVVVFVVVSLIHSWLGYNPFG
ncbi:NnrU family protein [Yoonia sp. MH D7]